MALSQNIGPVSAQNEWVSSDIDFSIRNTFWCPSRMLLNSRSMALTIGVSNFEKKITGYTCRMCCPVCLEDRGFTGDPTSLAGDSMYKNCHVWSITLDGLKFQYMHFDMIFHFSACEP